MKKVMIITGGSEGLGKTMAELFVKDYVVYIMATSKDKLEKTAKELNCNYIVCDVTDTEKLVQEIEAVAKKEGKIDALINNAGIWLEGDFDGYDYDQINKVIDINVKGLINGTRAAIKHMPKGSTIVNINSQAGINWTPQRSIYHASKWAITGFTKSLQLEYNKQGIRITDILPGMMKTAMFEKAGNDKDFGIALETIEIAKSVEFILNLPAHVTIQQIGIKNVMN